MGSNLNQERIGDGQQELWWRLIHPLIITTHTLYYHCINNSTVYFIHITFFTKTASKQKYMYCKLCIAARFKEILV